MRSKFMVVCFVFAALAGCEQANDEPTASIAALDEDEFIVTGAVADAKDGVEPDGGFPEDVEGAEDFGGIAVRPVNEDDSDGLEDCETVQDAYVMYYTEETLFDPPATDAAAGFPETIEGITVTAQGTIHSPAADEGVDEDADASPATDGCVLIADRVEIEEQTEDQDDGDDGPVGQTGDGGDASPGATGSPGADEEEVDPGEEEFPEHEDTDPIFEGTPSPDPCEGQKACEEKREEGEID